MSAYKTMIAEAISRYPLTSAPEWAKVGAPAGVDVARIEPDCASITTVDCLFDGHATIVLTDQRMVHATVFGRFDGRRAEVERIVPA
jgi:hypothetical protein